MLQVQGVSKAFGRKPVLNGVSLEVRQGELLAVLGPSGCGKTTLLRIIGGYERPSKGRILMNGADLTAAPVQARNMGMVFQSYALFPHMTALDNVAFGLRMRGVPSEDREDRALAMLDQVELREAARRRPGQLSGGEQQRVALARALVVEPSVLLLDEPLANVDRTVRLRLRDQLRDLQRRLRITTILVTHDHEEALSLADRIAILAGGRIRQCATPLELCLQPADHAVADFLGLPLPPL